MKKCPKKLKAVAFIAWKGLNNFFRWIEAHPVIDGIVIKFIEIILKDHL